MNNCFIDQIASQDILLRVTNLCGVCYDDLKLGEMIYYDMQEYRYLCQKCYEELSDKMNSNCEVVDDGEGLFG
jgi:hypothetical protein